MSENETVEFVKGSWQDNLNKSVVFGERSEKAKKAAGVALWRGAQQAIETWMPTSTTDTGAEGLYSEVLEIMGTSRKGDASKIKTVAVAVREHSLDLSTFKNLSGAYTEAVRLTKTQAAEAAEDDAAEEVIESIEAPKTATTPESAALIVFSKGMDGAVVALLDALNGPSGAHNEAAHRAFLRALTSEIADRVQAAKPKPEPKAKPVKEKAPATATSKAAPAEVKTKAKPAPKEAPVADEEDEVEVEDSDVTEEAPVTETPAKAKPVRRRPVPKR